MANTTINGVSVIRGTIAMELIGVWVADLVIDQPDGSGFSAGTKVTIQTETISLVGTVVPNRTGDFLDAVHVSVQGGGAGMAKAATARGFMQPGAFVRDVLNALCSNGGETLSSTADPTFVATNLAAWMIKTGTITENLRALLDLKAPTFNWRILSDGTLWMGTETWPEASGTFDILDQDPKNQSFDLGVESPWIVPGQNLSGVGNVSSVIHSIEYAKIRSHVLVDIPGEERGMGGDVAAIVAHETARMDYFGLYECNVVTQSGNTVDVQPTNQKFSGLQRVPLRHGVPGLSITVAPGAKVLLGWLGGDPSLPFAALWPGSETVLALQLAGTHPAPLWDNFLSALTTWVTAMQTMINALVTPTGILTPAQTTAAAACATMLGLISGGTLTSVIVSNG